ncbi:MAG: S8/S53 family peptidase [Candidatus Eremiobacteraeota bacterium]|nr:S8/S53 family peptidase [Candidatus Eremiobacteraeota bacterium]
MKYIASAALAVATAAAAVPAGAAAAIHQTGMPMIAVAQTSTHGFPALRGSRDLGRVSDAMPMHVALGLAPRNTAQIDVLIKRQNTPGDSMYQRFLTPSEVNALFAPSGQAVQNAAAYLQQRGFRNIKGTPDNLIVTADGTAAIASAAFGTEIHALANNGARVYANTLPARVPATLAGTVTSVLGLNNYSMHPMIRYAPAKVQNALRARHTIAATTSAFPCQQAVGTLCVLNGYDAFGFQTAYDAPPFNGNSNLWGKTGKSTTIALFTEGDMTNVLTDLVKYEDNNVPVLPHVKVNVVNAGIPSPDVSGQDEFDLDSQTSTGMAGNVKSLYLYVATTLTDSDTAVDFDRFKTDDIAKAGSASFGECELFPMLDGAEVLEDKIFAEAAVQGQTIFSSAGDNGFTCPVVASTGVPGTGLPAQSYPGVSPYVVSVGGTTLITTVGTGAYNEEISWYGTGGGMSLTENAPYWQAGVVSKVATTAAYKEVPDVAMDADPDTGANVYVNGAIEGVGGTSLSSPLSLGVWARLETLHSNKLGFAAPLFYEEYEKYTTYNSTLGLYVPPTPPLTSLTQPIGGFHDVIVGTNGFPAAPGYDTTTGLGTFDISKSFSDLPTK